MVTVLVLLLLTAASAFFDAKGFVQAAAAWQQGAFRPVPALWSLLNFVLGVTLYIGTIGLHQRLGNASAALQSVFWFAMTVAIVAALDGALVRWSAIQVAVGVAVVAGLAWLLWAAPH